MKYGFTFVTTPDKHFPVMRLVALDGKKRSSVVEVTVLRCSGVFKHDQWGNFVFIPDKGSKLLGKKNPGSQYWRVIGPTEPTDVGPPLKVRYPGKVNKR